MSEAIQPTQAHALTVQAQGIIANNAFQTIKNLKRNNLITKGSQIITLDDMLRAYYPWEPRYGGSPDYFSKIQKADDPLLSSTSGFLNRVYGEMVWNQLNMEANIWSIFPKRPWTRSGMRFLSAHSATGGGIAEDGTIPDADIPEFKEGYSDPKVIAHPFQLSMVANLRAEAQDDTTGDPMELLRNYTANKHRSDMNVMLGAEADTLAANNLESIDRMINATAVVTGGLITAGDEDFEHVDRSAESWADSYVSLGATPGVDRDLTLEMIRTMRTGVRRYQDVPGSQKIWITGEDTFDRISSLYEAQNRFQQTQVKVQPSLNGVRVVEPGVEAGFYVASLFGDPVFISKDIQKDTLSRLYYLDLAYTHIDILAPTQYFIQGPSTGNPWAVNKLIDEALFVTMGELRCRKFNAHGVLRDLQ